MDRPETETAELEVPEQTREAVFERDGQRCWLCNSETNNLQITQQINAAFYISQL
jgi:hypothetical protein